MKHSRIGLLIATAVLVIVGGLPAVAFAQPSPTPVAPGTDSGSTETSAGPADGHGMLSGVLHGEGLVQTKKGPVRVAMQNGEATALTQTSVTVRSSDGYTRTWVLDKNVKVYDKRHTLQPGALRAGADLAIAGTAPAANGSASAAATPTSANYTAKVVLIHSS
jgi:hypothetical protein